MKGDSGYCRRLALAAGVFSSLAATQASADSCERSREFLLSGLAGELPQAPQSYKTLFNVCTATADLANVKDVFILKDGGIGIVARNDSVGATAATLSEFCRRFPRATLRFIPRPKSQRPMTIAQTVGVSSGGATSCLKIRGLAGS